MSYLEPEQYGHRMVVGRALEGGRKLLHSQIISMKGPRITFDKNHLYVIPQRRNFKTNGRGSSSDQLWRRPPPPTRPPTTLPPSPATTDNVEWTLLTGRDDDGEN